MVSKVRSLRERFSADTSGCHRSTSYQSRRGSSDCPCAQTNRNPVHIRQGDALSGQALQRNDPLRPGGGRRRSRIRMNQYRRLARRIRNRHVERFSGVAGDTDVLMRPLCADRAGRRNIRKDRLTRRRSVMSRHGQTDIDIRAI